MPKIFFPLSRTRFIDQKEVINGLKEIALDLAARNKKIEAVYLFGSYAKGNAGIYSDADILVVLSGDDRSLLGRLDEFILEFSEGPVPVDVLVYTRLELEAGIKEGNHFLSSAKNGLRLV